MLFMSPVLRRRIFENKHSIATLLLGSLGGFILSLTGFPIGWMIGACLTASLLFLWQPKRLFDKQEKKLPRWWKNVGQLIVAVQVGQQVTKSVFDVFQDNWMVLSFIMFLSILLSLISGFLFWRYSKLDISTSFLAATPGGMTANTCIVEEKGGNIAVVGMTQLMRVVLVVNLVPVIAFWHASDSNVLPTTMMSKETGSFTWTLVLVLTAWLLGYLGKYVKIPAPWLTGGIIGVSIVELVGSHLAGTPLLPIWPDWLIIIAQVLIGVSVASAFHPKMFKNAQRNMMIGLTNSLGLILIMFLCSILLSQITPIPLVTLILALAPGGIAEMATVAFVFQADVEFVVTVAILRYITIIMILPPLFRWFSKSKRIQRKENERLLSQL